MFNLKKQYCPLDYLFKRLFALQLILCHHLFPFLYYSTVMVEIGPVISPTNKPSRSSNPSLILKSLDSTSTTLHCCSRVIYIWSYLAPFLASLSSSLVKSAFTASQWNKCDCWSSASRFEHFKWHLKSPLKKYEKLHLKFLVIALHMIKKILVIFVVSEKLLRYDWISNLSYTISLIYECVFWVFLSLVNTTFLCEL